MMRLGLLALLAALTATDALPTGMEMVTMDGGSALQGTYISLSAFFDTTPAHEVYISPFAIARTEVTNAQYAEYLNEAMDKGEVEYYVVDDQAEVYGNTLWNDSVVRAVKGVYAGEQLIDLSMQADDGELEVNQCWIRYDLEDDWFYIENDTYANWPVVGVMWYGAFTFAEHYNVSLPSEAQWEFAAVFDQDSWDYPTSTGDLSPDEANYNRNVGHVTEVCSYPESAGALCDMAGNVHEWVYDWWNETFYQDLLDGIVDPNDPVSIWGTEPEKTAGGWFDVGFDNDTRIIRSGSYNYPDYSLQSRYRQASYPFLAVDHFGFRVVDNNPEVASQPEADDDGTDVTLIVLLVCLGVAVVVGAVLLGKKYGAPGVLAKPLAKGKTANVSLVDSDQLQHPGRNSEL